MTGQPADPGESALIVEVPEAEPLVGPWRRLHDSSAALGVPAHVTILYPFVPPDRIDAATMDGIRSVAAAHQPFSAALASVSTFPGHIVWLAPVPDAPFRALAAAVWARFPDHPPYEGRHADVIPHLTVGEGDSASVPLLHREVERDLSGRLPLAFRVEALSLFVAHDGRWAVQRRFALGGDRSGS